MENRLIELETRVAFQDDTIEQLNQIITTQQQQIDRLHKEVVAIVARISESGEAASNIANQSEETPPPHY